MTTKQRAYLKGLAMTMDPIFQVGKASMNPGLTEAIAEALEATLRRQGWDAPRIALSRDGREEDGKA